MSDNANDIQIGGSHYKAEYQHWDFVRRVLFGRYLEGQVTKYLTRWRKKNGVEDLRKALHYLAKLSELFAAGLVRGMPTIASRAWVDSAVDHFLDANGLTDRREYELFHVLSVWSYEEDLRRCATLINDMIAEQQTAAEPNAGYVKQ